MNRLSGLYVITDQTLSRDRSDEEVVSAALAGGARVIQLREKTLPRPELVRLGKRLRQITAQAKALFIVNDDPELAAEVGADGVHLGPGDPAPSTARAILGPNAIVGWSVKGSLDMARQAAAEGVDYIAVGSIFATSTKAGAIQVGLQTLRNIRAAVDLPIAPIGGISQANIGDVAAAGADMACVISAVVAAPDVELAARRLSEALAAHKGNTTQR